MYNRVEDEEMKSFGFFSVCTQHNAVRGRTSEIVQMWNTDEIKKSKLYLVLYRIYGICHNYMRFATITIIVSFDMFTKYMNSFFECILLLIILHLYYTAASDTTRTLLKRGSELEPGFHRSHRVVIDSRLIKLLDHVSSFEEVIKSRRETPFM